jgi:hypothetical protein
MDETMKKKFLWNITAYIVVAAIIIAAIIITRRPIISDNLPEPNVVAVLNAPAAVNVPATVNIAVEVNSPAVEIEMVGLLCKNPVCGYRFEIDRREVEGKMPVRPGVEIPVFKCPKCSQDSAYIEITCEKCGNVFVLSYQKKGDYADRCPKCGFSKFEETTKSMSQ